MKRRYNWIPDRPDFRDHPYRIAHGAAATLPPRVDLRPLCSPVEDQGELGSCTGNAIVGALEFLEMKSRPSGKGPVPDLSRLFVYYQERVIEHDVGQDNGAQIRDGVKACAKVGVCTEPAWPYDVAKFAKKPSAAAYKDARARKISDYLRVMTLDGVRANLADGFPVVFGFSVYESFESAAVAKSGIVPMPKKTERMVGGHAVLAVGYDDKAKRIIVRNSWGTGWGLKGYFLLPYGYITDRGLSDDFWTVRR